MNQSHRWAEALELHRAAANQYMAAVEALDDESWSAPVAPGKWSPASVTEHLNRAYEVVLAELGGGPGMQIRTRAWQRVLLRFTIVPKLLRGGWFPAGARAPRETRPPDAPGPRAEVMARFTALADRFEHEMEATRRRDPGTRLTHAYFGRAGLADTMLLCTRHIEHHTRQVAAVARA